MASVFISYSWDDKDFVVKLRRGLQDRGISVDIDEQFILVGDDLPVRITSAIDRCDFFLIVLSPSATFSKWVKKEFEYAQARARQLHYTFILGAYYKTCEFTEQFVFFENKVFADFRNQENFDKALGEIIAAINKIKFTRNRPPSSFIQQQIAPSKVASIRNKIDSGRQIFLIHDSPSVYEAQKAIIDILRDIIKKWHVGLILVEGGKGDLSVSYLRRYGSVARRTQAAEEFLKKGLISAEEYLDVSSDCKEPLTLYGVDDVQMRSAAEKALLEAMERKEYMNDDCNRIIEKLTLLQQKILKGRLRQVEEHVKKFNEDDDSPEHLISLIAIAEQTGLVLDLYPNISAYKAIYERAKDDISIAKVQQEQQEAIKLLRNYAVSTDFDDLMTAASALRDGAMAETDFYQLLANLIMKYGLWQKSFKTLQRYCEYQKLIGNVSLELLAEEVSRLVESLRSLLITTESEGLLIHALRDFLLACRIVQLRVIPMEYEEYKRHQTCFGWIVGFIESFAQEKEMPLDRNVLRSLLDCAKENAKFYEKVYVRSACIVNNSIKIMEDKGEGNAILITAGFLGKFVRDLLVAKGEKVIDIMPLSEDFGEYDKALYKLKQVLLYKSGKLEFSQLSEEKCS